VRSIPTARRGNNTFRCVDRVLPRAIVDGLAAAQHGGAGEGRKGGSPSTDIDAFVYLVTLLRTQDLHAVVMGVLVGPAAAAAADVLKVFPVSARAARLVMSKVARMSNLKQASRDKRLFPQGHSC
jgi:hypothetical protein